MSETSNGYLGLPRELLNKAEAKVGDRIRIVREKDETIEGILMPRLHSGDENDSIVVKLKTGYNIGIRVSDKIQLTVIGEGVEPHFTRPPLPEQTRSLPKISIISTGGTIASKVDYRTGAVKPALDAEDIYSVVPELGKIANVNAIFLSNIFSENIGPQQWSLIASTVQQQIINGAEGVVIAHGTDTLGYTAAALSFALNNPPVPVILVGSQRSSDRPSSDAAANLMAATATAAKLPFAEVAVAMHDWISDQKIAIHLGTRVRKCHTSRRDAFESPNSTPLAYYDLTNQTLEIKNNNLQNRKTAQGWSIKPKFNPNVALIKFYPGISVGIIDWAIATGYKGIVIEGTGLGHVAETLFPSIERAINEGIVVTMCSQCIWGTVNMNVYSTGRDLLRIGVIPLTDMLAETALAKMMWAFENEPDAEGVKKLMTTNLRGEISTRRTLENDGFE